MQRIFQDLFCRSSMAAAAIDGAASATFGPCQNTCDPVTKAPRSSGTRQRLTGSRPGGGRRRQLQRHSLCRAPPGSAKLRWREPQPAHDIGPACAMRRNSAPGTHAVDDGRRAEIRTAALIAHQRLMRPATSASSSCRSWSGALRRRECASGQNFALPSQGDAAALYARRRLCQHELSGWAGSVSLPIRRCSPRRPMQVHGNYGYMDQAQRVAMGSAQHRRLRRQPEVRSRFSAGRPAAAPSWPTSRRHCHAACSSARDHAIASGFRPRGPRRALLTELAAAETMARSIPSRALSRDHGVEGPAALAALRALPAEKAG